MSIVIRNDHLPAGERFECWRETACQVRMAPVEVESDHQAGFRFAMRYCDLGATRVSMFTAMPYRVRRTPKLIRQSDPERLSIGMLLHGHGIADQSDRQAHLPSAAFTLYDSSRPYRIDITPARGARAAPALIVNFPRTLLPLPPGQVKQVTAVTMPASPGIGTLTSRLLVQLATGMDHYTAAEAARLSGLPAGSGRPGASRPPGRRAGGTLGVSQRDSFQPRLPRRLRPPATRIPPGRSGTRKTQVAAALCGSPRQLHGRRAVMSQACESKSTPLRLSCAARAAPSWLSACSVRAASSGARRSFVICRVSTASRAAAVSGP